jgi:hypothetical protein
MAFDTVTSSPQWSPDSQYMREMRKWEKPYRYERYPAMLYRATKRPSGGPFICVDPHDEKFSAQNQRTVHNAEEEARAIDEGWRKSPEAAVEFALSLEKAVADAAAERHFADRRLSEKARAEAAEVDDATAEHVPVITPAAVREARKRRG